MSWACGWAAGPSECVETNPPTMALGIVGSQVGGFLYWLIQGAPHEPFSRSGNAWAGWIMAIIGAVLALWIYRAGTPRRG